MRRPWLLWLGALLLAGAVHVWSLDGILGNGFLLLFGDDSSYSTDYSDVRFRSVEIGDLRSDVVKKLGVPLEIVETDDPRTQVLHFSISRNSTHYRVRAIEIRDGVVSNKYAQAWVD